MIEKNILARIFLTVTLGCLSSAASGQAVTLSHARGSLPSVSDMDYQLIQSGYRCPPAHNGYVIKIGPVLCFFDDITEHSLEQFMRLSSGVQILSLGSGGGGLKAALEISDMVRDKGWITLVPAREQCWSACVNILSSGRLSVADRTARVGVHFTVLPDENGVWGTDPDVTLFSLEKISPLLAHEFRKSVEQESQDGLYFWRNHYPNLHDLELSPQDLISKGVIDVISQTRNYR